MNNKVAVGVALACLFSMVVLEAQGGETRWLGSLSSDGGTTSNVSVTYDAGCYPLTDGGPGVVTDGGTACQAGSDAGYNLTAAWAIPAGAKITVDCTGEARLLTDSFTVATTGVKKGVRVAGGQLFPTSVGRALTTIDGGSGGLRFPTAVVSMVADAGVTCDFFERSGTE